MPAAAYPTWSPGELRTHREAAGYTQEQVADKIAEISERHGFDPPLHPSDRMVRKHEADGRPSRRYRRAYALLYNDGTSTDATRLPEPAAAPGEVPSPLRDTAHPTGQQGGNSTDRRGFTGLVAVALGTPGIGGLPELTSGDRLATLDRAAGAGGAVTAAEGILDAIVGDYLTLPPRAVLGRVAALQQVTDFIQAEYLLPPAGTARLWKVAGTAAGIRGWLENNAGDTQAARLSLREAYRRGELIGDRQLMAWARFMQAIVEDHAGDPVAAEHYALDGIRHTSKGGPQRALLLGAAIAPIRAAKGDRDGTEKCITEAHGIVTGLSPEQHGNDQGKIIVDAMATYSPAGFASDAGSAYAVLGRPDRFSDVTAGLRQAADRAETPHRVSFRMNEAAAVIRSADADPERAAALAQEGLALASPFQAAYVANRLDLVLDAAKPFETHPAIRDLIECSATLRTESFAPSTDT